ncbi:serine/threonine-protein kinase [Paenibacillus sp. R14(2021)]|uniref:serine/threonine-protein kinase n=1 Tax=Paenibacillus sp. R14(2021) TaxID=2859228 RepID=UPI001C615CC8|nr:serine/threonine-protein kinase [Paenibacillus sp. R14(2021)]
MSQAQFESGMVVGERYRISRLIGRGGMGEVYAAEDLRLHGKLRALKVNRPFQGNGLRSAEEAGLLMRLNHPHLPLIVDYFPAADDGGLELLVMDYIDGITLQDYLAQQGGFITAEQTLEIGVQLADALRYLHQQQPPIIHRDLKPTNVMIDRSGFVRLIDFGIARQYKFGQAQDTITLGTPGFAAPEQEGDRQSDARTDVFGLGALLYYLMSGGNRLSGNGMMTGLPDRNSVARACLDIIGRMTDPVPARRFNTMEDAGNALGACLLGTEGTLHFPARSSENNPPRQARKQHVMVAALSPGAGATFTAITLARLLEQQGDRSIAAIEHPDLEPEWHALVPEANHRPGTPAQAAADRRYLCMASPSKRLDWYMLDPATVAIAALEAEQQLKHRFMLQSIEAPIRITDVSSHWMHPDTELQLIHCDLLIVVADPFPSKWTLHRMSTMKRISGERERAGRSTYWIANKDAKFRARSEWLAMLPVKPVCSIPLLPGDEWADYMWSGKWATLHPRWKKLLESGFQPVFRAIYDRC